VPTAVPCELLRNKVMAGKMQVNCNRAVNVARSSSRNYRQLSVVHMQKHC
jgi:hypothetical protein